MVGERLRRAFTLPLAREVDRLSKAKAVGRGVPEMMSAF
jgi:hypothetical protein